MKLRVWNVMLMGGLVLLAACGGGGGGMAPVPPEPSEIATFRDRLVRQDNLDATISDLPGTAFAAVPATGRTTFRGFGTADIERPGGGTGNDLHLLGYAELEANFTRATIQGDITNIQGYVGPRATADSLFRANGKINIGTNASEIDNQTSPTNNWSALYSANLTSPEGRIRMRGEMEGRFRGTNPFPGPNESTIKGLTGSSADGRVTIDGVVAPGFRFDVTAQN